MVCGFSDEIILRLLILFKKIGEIAFLENATLLVVYSVLVYQLPGDFSIIDTSDTQVDSCLSSNECLALHRERFVRLRYAQRRIESLL